MNPELLMTELERAEEAELQSDEQLRQLPALIDQASKLDAKVNATDCHKIISAALALNERLHDRTAKLRAAIATANRTASRTA